tara:strand:+ start:351 stop:482 length:132 start_codon:yes stop_codon:yes gene_type:complete
MSWRWLLAALLLGFILNLIEIRKVKKLQKGNTNSGASSPHSQD